jgi:hypothetical protein
VALVQGKTPQTDLMVPREGAAPLRGFAPSTPRSLFPAQDYEFHPVGCSLVP